MPPEDLAWQVNRHFGLTWDPAHSAMDDDLFSRIMTRMCQRGHAAIPTQHKGDSSRARCAAADRQLGEIVGQHQKKGLGAAVSGPTRIDGTSIGTQERSWQHAMGANTLTFLFGVRVARRENDHAKPLPEEGSAAMETHSKGVKPLTFLRGNFGVRVTRRENVSRPQGHIAELM